MGDAEFDKKFVVRAEHPETAAAFLPAVTRAMLVENRNRLFHHSVHFWTWDRYLFSLSTASLNEKSGDLRLPIMAKMIENVG